MIKTKLSFSHSPLAGLVLVSVAIWCSSPLSAQKAWSPVADAPVDTPRVYSALKMLLIKDDVESFQDKIISGDSKAYGFHVPAKGFLAVSLEHPSSNAYKLMMATDKGRQLPGMISNRVRAFQQAVRFENTEGKDVDLVVLVQGPGREDVFGKSLATLSLPDSKAYESPYRIVINRNPAPIARDK